NNVQRNFSIHTEKQPDTRSLQVSSVTKKQIMIFFLFLFLSFSDDRAVKLLRGNCPTFWYTTPMRWADAEFHCLSQGANLVSIHNMEEENFVRLLIENFDHEQRGTWIGLSDIHKEGRWMWSDGSVVDFYNWKKGEPNNKSNEDCVTKNYRTFKKWNDWPCSSNCPSVCVKHKVCA
uniref:C-type lectin domain-containing protein n=1 Tax=Oreochromis niloticus TaxID=8128 RepID=A0A669EGR2_ORENI